MPNQRLNNQDGIQSTFQHATSSDDYISRQVTSMLDGESARKRILEVICDHIDSVTFMKKVQEYADTQIDKRLFKNVKVVIGLAVSWILTAVITYLVTKYTK